MDSLNDSRSLHFHDCLSDFFSVLASEDKLGLSCARSLNLAVFVDITVSVSAENDWLFPAGNGTGHILYENRCAENSSVQLATDNSVGAWGKLL